MRSNRIRWQGLGLLLALVMPLAANALQCPPPNFTPPDQVKLTGDEVLVVTHPSIAFDGRMASKVGMDQAVRLAKSRKIPVIYLKDDGPESEYFFGDCSPDYWLHSVDGDISIDFQPSHLYTVGGHWELCQSRTLHDVMFAWSRQGKKRDLKITTFMDGVYMKGSMSFQETDPYHDAFQRFVGIVNYGRGGEAFNNKLTMLEAMGIIVNGPKQLDFLTRSLPHYERTLPDYRVQIVLDGSSPKVLQKGKGFNPPTLTFEFISSAANLDSPFGP
ncbi:MAG: hypothetical protein NDJ90_14405 [Oligoflexia bacterium]|nr:hypothetical protein [Oligoflexia bacterium]